VQDVFPNANRRSGDALHRRCAFGNNPQWMQLRINEQKWVKSDFCSFILSCIHRGLFPNAQRRWSASPERRFAFGNTSCTRGTLHTWNKWLKLGFYPFSPIYSKLHPLGIVPRCESAFRMCAPPPLRIWAQSPVDTTQNI